MSHIKYRLENIRHLGAALELLRGLEVAPEDFCIIGSSVLAMLGIRTNRDLDICVRQNVFELIKVKTRGAPGWIHRQSGPINFGEISFSTDEYKKFNIFSQDLLDNPEFHIKVGATKVARPELYFSQITVSHRKKHIADIRNLTNYALENADWNWGAVRRPVAQHLRGKARVKHQLKNFAKRIVRFSTDSSRWPRVIGRIAKYLTTPQLWPIRWPLKPSGQKLSVSVVLWPAAEALFDKITEQLALEHRVEQSVDFTIGVTEMKAFVRGLYEYEKLDQWIVEHKLYHLAKRPGKIRLLTVIIDARRWELSKTTNELVSVDSRNMKKSIREKFRSQIDQYVHDIIIHASDSPAHGVWTTQLLKKYGCPAQEYTAGIYKKVS